MPYKGGTNGGGEGGGLDPISNGMYQVPLNGASGNSGIPKSTPKTTITKKVSYVAGTAPSNQILALTGTDSATVTIAESPKQVVIHNTGPFPIVVLLGYQMYTDENTDSESQNTVFLHSMVLPGESIIPNMRGIISVQGEQAANSHADFANQSLYLLDGEVVDFIAPNTDLRTDSGATLAAHVDTPDTTITVSAGEFFRVGDLIQLGDDSGTTTKVEIMEVTAIATDVLTVTRGLYGSNINDKDAQTDATDGAVSGAKVTFPFFNELHDYDRILSGSSQLVQTDGYGKFKSNNFFGYGRVDTSTATNSQFGLVPGSIAIRFYSNPFQEIAMGGTGVAGGAGVSNIPITSGSESKLATNTAYAFNLILDDSASTTVSFTTDTNSTRFGGSGGTGVIAKMQDAITTATRTVGNALYGYSCSLSIQNGKLRFTSGSSLIPHNGTNGSKISVLDGGSGTNLFDGAQGIFPDITQANAAVAPKLPDLNKYDPITYAKTPNLVGICHDNGHGALVGAAEGEISYETGKLYMRNAPANSSFEVSVVHNSPFSGALDPNKSADINSLKAIHANVLSKNYTSEIKVETW